MARALPVGTVVAGLVREGCGVEQRFAPSGKNTATDAPVMPGDFLLQARLTEHDADKADSFAQET